MNTHSHGLADAAPAQRAQPGEAAPDNAPHTTEAHKARATGAYDALRGPVEATYVQHSVHTSAPAGAELRIVREGQAREPDRQKPFEAMAVVTPTRPDARRSSKATWGTRTPDLSFTKAPLYQLS